MTPEQRSRAMKHVALRNGPLEKVVQGRLRAMGVKYRRHGRSLPGSPDIVLAKQRIVIFVEGDFWHGWRLPAWEHKLSTWWRNKLRANRARDQRNCRRLRASGWKVFRLWEHQVKDRARLTHILRKIHRTSK